MPSHKLNGTTPGDTVPVIKPQNYPNSEFAEGVGTPQVVTNANTDTTYLLFTGFTDSSDRKLFVADIDGSLNIQNPRKVAEGSDVGLSYIDGAYAFYDTVNNEFIVSMTCGVDSSGLALAAFSGDFSSVNSSETYAINVSDSGASPVITRGGELNLTVVKSTGNLVWLDVQADYYSRPFSTSVTEKTFLIQESDWFVPDVHHTTLNNSGIQMLVETDATNSLTGGWRIHPAFGGHFNGGRANHRVVVSREGLLQFEAPSGGGQFGHPTHNTELGRPIIFFDFFSNLAMGEEETFRHEIWAQEVPHDYLRPRNWFPLSARMLNSQGISDIVNTFGASKAILYIDATASGTLTLREMHESGTFISGYATRTASISTSGINRVVFDDPMAAIQVETDFGVNKVDLELRE